MTAFLASVLRLVVSFDSGKEWFWLGLHSDFDLINFFN